VCVCVCVKHIDFKFIYICVWAGNLKDRDSEKEMKKHIWYQEGSTRTFVILVLRQQKMLNPPKRKKKRIKHNSFSFLVWIHISVGNVVLHRWRKISNTRTNTNNQNSCDIGRGETGTHSHESIWNSAWIIISKAHTHTHTHTFSAILIQIIGRFLGGRRHLW
jgi:hypothetical protein